MFRDVSFTSTRRRWRSPDMLKKRCNSPTLKGRASFRIRRRFDAANRLNTVFRVTGSTALLRSALFMQMFLQPLCLLWHALLRPSTHSSALHAHTARYSQRRSTQFRVYAWTRNAVAKTVASCIAPAFSRAFEKRQAGSRNSLCRGCSCVLHRGRIPQFC